MFDNDKSKIEDIKRKLYDVDDEITRRPHEGVLHSINYKVKDQWESEKNENNNMKINKNKSSFSKKFFAVSIFVLIGAVAFSLFMFFRGNVSVSNENIDITVFGNAFTKGGEELPLQIEITNRNNASLELANLIIEYPKGASDNQTEIVRMPRDPIGTILPGESVVRNVKVKLFGDEKSIRSIKISLEYHPEGSNAIFTKDGKYDVTISTAPLSLVVNAPENVTSEQFISFSVTASLNTSLPDNNTILQIKYPQNFIYDSAIPEPALGNSSWDLSGLSPNNPITVNVKGKIIGQENDEQVFHVYAGSPNSSNRAIVDVVYNSFLHSIKISKPFFEAKVLINGEDTPNPYISGGEKVNVQIDYTNNLSSLINNAEIIVNLDGNAFDKNSISSTQGFYDSLNNRIIWDRNTTSDLSSVEPGRGGSVGFSINSLPVSNIKDPKIVLRVSVKGTEPSYGLNFNQVNNFVEKIVRVSSDFQIASSVNYFAGSLPPKAETETKYLVTWSLYNSINQVNQARAVASLPVYVDWVSASKSDNNTISYNQSTREIIWNIGSVKPETGSNFDREVSFIISIKPSTSQIGSEPQLVKDIVLTGVDSYTGELIKTGYRYVTTMLTNDPNFKSGYQRVVN